MSRTTAIIFCVWAVCAVAGAISIVYLSARFVQLLGVVP